MGGEILTDTFCNLLFISITLKNIMDMDYI